MSEHLSDTGSHIDGRLQQTVQQSSALCADGGLHLVRQMPVTLHLLSYQPLCQVIVKRHTGSQYGIQNHSSAPHVRFEGIVWTTLQDFWCHVCLERVSKCQCRRKENNNGYCRLAW